MGSNRTTDKNRLSIVGIAVAKYWDYEKNFPLTPNDVSFNSIKLVWWICPKCCCSHQKSIRSVSQGVKLCGICDKKSKSFPILYPLLFQEWDYDKNKGVDPYTVCP